MSLFNFFIKVFRVLYSIIKRELTPYGYLRGYILFPIAGFYRTYVSRSYNNNKIRLLKDKHSGNRCFIVATGPSLLGEDVDKLKNEFTIGVNSIFRLYEKMNWRPNYYVILDANLCNKYNANGFINPDDFAKDMCFFNSICKKTFTSEKVVYLHTNWLNHVYNYGNLEFKYTPDMVFGLYDFYSVTHACIQIAMYMGFKEIYLIGVDNNYTGGKTHFVETKGDDVFDYNWALTTQKSMDAGYEAIRNIANKQGVKIFNATRGGNVKAFERVNLDEVINDSRTN